MNQKYIGLALHLTVFSLITMVAMFSLVKMMAQGWCS